MRATVCGMMLLLLLVLLPSSSAAQATSRPEVIPPDTSTGLQFWIGLELGYGIASPICTACGEEGIQGGTSGNVFLGLVFNRTLAIGLQASVWVDGAGLYEKREDKIYRTFFSLFLCHYPWEDHRWFGKAGIGYSAYTAYNRYEPPSLDPAGNTLPSEVHSEGAGVLLGIGCDFPVARDILLTPTLTYSYGGLGQLVLNNSRSLGEQKPLHMLELNLSIAYRSAE